HLACVTQGPAKNRAKRRDDAGRGDLDETVAVQVSEGLRLRLDVVPRLGHRVQLEQADTERQRPLPSRAVGVVAGRYVAGSHAVVQAVAPTTREGRRGAARGEDGSRWHRHYRGG